MKTKTQNQKSELKSRPEQLSTTATTPKQGKGTGDSKQLPYVDFRQREANRQLPTERVLAALRRWMPNQFKLAEVVGQWVWIHFSEAPVEQVRRELSELGFHWNRKRQTWQHPCGKMSAGSSKDPREKYTNHFAANT